ncbi:MAG: cyclopropane fatty acyl phospholipid synthase [bacterium]
MEKRGLVEKVVRDTLKKADIEIGGNRPWDLRVKDQRFFWRAFRDRNLGVGEAFMDGWVECDHWDQFSDRFCRTVSTRQLPFSLSAFLHGLRDIALNLGTKSRAFTVGERHYDIGNDLYERMLDKRMVYTCGYWKDAADLDSAQEAKLDLVCRKVGLKEGMKVLDIGCGWGSFAKFAAERYGAHVTGVTVSKEQLELAERSCAGLPVEFKLQDYRDITGQFDAVVSLGMFEHVGCKNYRTYMEVVDRTLKDDGLFLLHTIGGNTSVKGTDPWIDRYIFPNSMLPSAVQITRAVEGLFVLEDWHSFGAYYDRTLMAWYENFARSWSELSAKYDERFRRMWEYYLLTCAGTFRARSNQLLQVVLSKRGVPGGYESIR